MNGPDGDSCECKEKTRQQMKEQQGERAITPAKDRGSQDGKAHNPRMEHPGQETAAKQQVPLDWKIRGADTIDWDIRGRTE